jgi:hypothetical protein
MRQADVSLRGATNNGCHLVTVGDVVFAALGDIKNPNWKESMEDGNMP